MNSPAVSQHPYPAKPLRVIHTKGTDLEIGRQHGELLREDVAQGMTRFYLEFWRRMMKAKGSSPVDRFFMEIGKLLIDPVLVGRLQKNIPPWAVDRMRGLAQASGISEADLLSTFILPDLMPMLQAYLGMIRPSALVEASQPPRFGCTSFFAKDKNFYQGRNLDFPGVSYWDRYPVVQLFEKPGRLKYIGFASAGVPIAGITGVNQAQLMVALHQHYSRKTSLTGKLPFVIAERILGEAKSLNEARQILSEEKVAASWAFVVSDGKTGEGFLQECDPEAKGILNYSDAEEVFSHSNFFQTKECQRREYATTARMNWDNFHRKNRLAQLLTLENGCYKPERLVQILSDHFDPYWGEEKIINRTISQVYNIQSLVVNLTEMKAWLALGNSPVHLNEYAELDLGEVFSGRTGLTGMSFPGYRFKDKRKQDAKTEYILSFVAAFDGDFKNAGTRIDASLKHDFTPEAALVAAILNLKQNDYIKGLNRLVEAKNFIESKKAANSLKGYSPEYFEIRLFLGRTLDLLGRREEAVKEYRGLASHVDLEDSNVRRLATQGKPYSQRQLERILMPYSSYIPFE